MNLLDRREFIQKLAMVSAVTASGLWWNPVRAMLSSAANPDHLFVHIVIEGGADCLMGLEPMMAQPGAGSNEFWRGYTDNEILQSGNIRLGPAAAALVPHAGDIALIRGIWMSTGSGDSHEHCRALINSGMRTSRDQAHTVGAQFSSLTNDKIMKAIINSPAEFRSRLKITSTKMSDLISADPASAAQRALLSGQMSPLGSRDSFAQSAQDVVRFKNVLATLTSSPSTADDLLATTAAMSAGITRHVHLNLGGDYAGAYPSSRNLDNHSGHTTDHLPNQKYYWEKVAELFRLFKQTKYLNTNESLFSKTTFYVSNEFSKTPWVSGSGKDHNPQTNTILLAGRGVRGGVAVGGSEFVNEMDSGTNASILIGMPIDQATERTLTRSEIKQWGQAPAGAQIIVPEHVVLTLCRILGIPQSSYPWITRPDLHALNSVIS